MAARTTTFAPSEGRCVPGLLFISMALDPEQKLGVVARGECWLALEGHEPVLLREGDFFLLGNPLPYVLASALTAKPRAAKSLWHSAANGAVRIGPKSEEDTYLCGGHSMFDDMNASILLDVLPLLVHVHAADPRGQAARTPE